MSAFTAYLNTLAGYATKLDTANFSYTDFIDLQRLQPAIEEGHQAKRYDAKQYRVLSNLYFLLMADARAVLK